MCLINNHLNSLSFSLLADMDHSKNSAREENAIWNGWPFSFDDDSFFCNAGNQAGQRPLAGLQYFTSTGL
jgi:hypothetical protein